MIERAVELTIETGGIAAAKRKLAALEEERAVITARLESCPPRVPSAQELRPRVEAGVWEIRWALAGEPRRAREVFGALLGDRRMEVHPDPERGFRVEGLFSLILEGVVGEAPADRRGPTGVRLCGSGGGLRPGIKLPAPIDLPMAGRMASAA